MIQTEKRIQAAAADYSEAEEYADRIIGTGKTPDRKNGGALDGDVSDGNSQRERNSVPVSSGNRGTQDALSSGAIAARLDELTRMPFHAWPSSNGYPSEWVEAILTYRRDRISWLERQLAEGNAGTGAKEGAQSLIDALKDPQHQEESKKLAREISRDWIGK